MARSNRDRVEQMFGLLARALDAFIAEQVAAKLDAGRDWADLVRAKDESNGITGREYDRGDVLVALRALTENVTGVVEAGWQPFNGTLGRVGRGYCTELREARNRWAHLKPFSNEEAGRCLDTAELLLRLIGRTDVADQVRAILLEVRRLSVERQDERVVRATVVSHGSTGLRPWREVLLPHDDVSTGNFRAAEFAANLYEVAISSEAQRDYGEPVEFFARTYLTAGLRELLTGAIARLVGDRNASPVVNLQTNFGGGKTHAMLALWHLASRRPADEYPQALQELLDHTAYRELPTLRRVALVGDHLSTSGNTKSDGTPVNTLWGELAWQLGGAEAFEIVAASDRARTPPGQALHELLARYAPALILIDEWVAYARTLLDHDDLAAGSFEDQFTFAQALTETAAATPGVLLAISIPASHTGEDGAPAPGSAEEVGGEHGLAALARLQNVVRRVADQWRPASATEAYHIVRRRLFSEPDAQALAAISQTARTFAELYQQRKDELPRETRDGSFEQRIKDTYPIHPELFDRLYQDWSALERFQRTRGVLRLMSCVIHALWAGEDQSPLIMPCSVPLAEPNVNAELTQYLQDAWKSVIDTDVDGEHAQPVQIDSERPLFGQRSLTRRLARTVFLGSAPRTGETNKGIDVKRVFLGTAMPGDSLGNFHAALHALSDRATYLYTDSGRYWYDLRPNIARQAKDQAERVPLADVHHEIVSRLEPQRKLIGAFAAVVLCPEEQADIADGEEARLVIVHPRHTHRRDQTDSDAYRFALQATEQRGAGPRSYRNTVVFLACDQARASELEAGAREYLGWKHVLDHANDLDLTARQQTQASSRAKTAADTLDNRLLLAYQWALMPYGQPVQLRELKVEGSSPSLAERVSQKLAREGQLAVQHAAPAIRHQLDAAVPGGLWKDGHLSVGELWQQYARYAYMPRLRDRSVLVAGLTAAPMLWRDEGFALAAGYEQATGRYTGLTLPDDPGGLTAVSITDATLIVSPDRALAQREAERPAQATGHGTAPHGPGAGPSSLGVLAGGAPAGPDGQPGPSTRSLPDPGGRAFPPPPAPPRKTRFYGSKHLPTERTAIELKKILDEVLAPLKAADGVHVTVTLDIEAITTPGFDDSTIRTVSENANTLHFDQSGFEEA